MKKLFRDLFLPTCIVAALILMMCSAYVADSIKTGVSSGRAVQVFADRKTAGQLTLVIDPGHGGADGGAVSVTGVKESTINLDIALKLESIAGFFGVKTVMTRRSEDIAYPEDADTIRKMKVYDQKSRVELINSIEYPVLLSIHQNNYSGSSAHGAQVFFKSSAASAELAGTLQDILEENVTGSTTREAQQIANDIYLFKNISCTAVMVECGFLSNPDENCLLNNDEYRTKLALAIAAGYLNQEPSIMKAYFGGTNESESSVLLY